MASRNVPRHAAGNTTDIRSGVWLERRGNWYHFRSTPLSGHQLGLRQKLPFPGLLSQRATAAKRSAEASALQVDDQRLLTDSAVEMAWAELGFAQQALEITSRNIT